MARQEVGLPARAISLPHSEAGAAAPSEAVARAPGEAAAEAQSEAAAGVPAEAAAEAQSEAAAGAPAEAAAEPTGAAAPEDIIGSQEDPLEPKAGGENPSASEPPTHEQEMAALAIACPPAPLLPGGMVPKLDTLFPSCRSCGDKVDPVTKGVRYFVKTQMFQCPRCNVRHVGIITIFGSTKFEEFQGISEEEKHQLFRSLPNNVAGMRQILRNFIIKRRIEIRRNSIVGKFLPLAVWAAKGYDADAIERSATKEDVEDHPVLGLTYRVKLRTSVDETSEQKIREEVAELGGGRKMLGNVEARKKHPKAEGAEGGDNSSSSSIVLI